MAWHETWNEPTPRRRRFFSDRGGFLPPGVILVLVITIGTYVVDRSYGGRLSRWGALSIRELLHFQVWRLFTYMFLHSLTKIDHILVNMFIFLMFGRIFERQIGTKRFLYLYLIGGLVGGVFEVGFNAVMYALYRSFPVPVPLPGGFVAVQHVSFLNAQAVGASAGVACVLVAFAVRNPRAIFLLFFIIPIQVRWLALGYLFIETRHILNALQYGWVDKVAHGAHFGGMVLGFVWVKFGDRVAAWWQYHRGSAGSRYTSRSRGREAKEEAEVDRILRKIHEQGIDSLTQREKLFLQETSRKHRQ